MWNPVLFNSIKSLWSHPHRVPRGVRRNRPQRFNRPVSPPHLKLSLPLTNCFLSLWNVQEAIDTINQTYEIDKTLGVWNYRGHALLTELRDQTELFACSGGVWTQTTDVEGEVNGLLTYDRRVLRPNETQWKADIQALYDAAKARSNSAMPDLYHL